MLLGLYKGVKTQSQPLCSRRLRLCFRRGVTQYIRVDREILLSLSGYQNWIILALGLLLRRVFRCDYYLY